MDREKVAKGLEEIANDKWMKIHADWYVSVCRDALALLTEQQPKTGHWLYKMSNYPSAIAMGGSRTSACDLCGGWGRKTFKYCPHCGAKMEKPTRT